MRQMQQFFPGSIDQISESAQAKALRNHIAHGYFVIDQSELWQIVKKDLPKLRAEVTLLQSSNLP